jgi:hypothetical protein
LCRTGKEPSYARLLQVNTATLARQTDNVTQTLAVGALVRTLPPDRRNAVSENAAPRDAKACHAPAPSFRLGHPTRSAVEINLPPSLMPSTLASTCRSRPFFATPSQLTTTSSGFATTTPQPHFSGPRFWLCVSPGPSTFALFALLPLTVGSLSGAMPFVVLACVGWAIAPRYMVWTAMRNVRRIIQEDDERFGPTTLTLSGNSLTVELPRMEIRLQLTAVRRVEQLPEALYVYYSSVDAVVVPLNKVSEGNVDDMVRSLKAKTSAGSATVPTST